MCQPSVHSVLNGLSGFQSTDAKQRFLLWSLGRQRLETQCWFFHGNILLNMGKMKYCILHTLYPNNHSYVTLSHDLVLKWLMKCPQFLDTISVSASKILFFGEQWWYSRRNVPNPMKEKQFKVESVAWCIAGTR